MKCNQSRPVFELVSPCPFPTTVTITPRAPPFKILANLLLFLTHGVFLCRIRDVMPNALLLVYLFLCIRRSSSFINLTNGFDYLSKGTAQVLIPLMRAQLHILVLSCFLVLLRCSFFYVFLHIRLLNGVHFQYSQTLISFLFFKCFDFIIFKQFIWFIDSYLLV